MKSIARVKTDGRYIRDKERAESNIDKQTARKTERQSKENKSTNANKENEESLSEEMDNIALKSQNATVIEFHRWGNIQRKGRPFKVTFSNSPMR